MAKNQGKNWQNEKPQESQSDEQDKLRRDLERELNIYDESGGTRYPDPWKVMDLAAKLGIPAPKIDRIQTKEFNLSSGKHYFVMENIAKRSIKCISCPITHGGILEAHLLTRYTLTDGVLSLDGKALNTAPKLPDVDKDITSGNNESKV